MPIKLLQFRKAMSVNCLFVDEERKWHKALSCSGLELWELKGLDFSKLLQKSASNGVGAPAEVESNKSFSRYL